MRGDNSETFETPTFTIVATGDDSVACLSGRIDMDFSPILREQLVSLMKSGSSKTLSIDLSGITHMDSSGIATLIEGLKIARSNGVDLRLQGLQGRILRLFEVTGILSLFNGRIRG